MKLSVRELMDVAHEVAKESFGRTTFNFSTLWTKTWANAKDFKKDNLENWIGTFYTELLCDARFVYLGPNQWKLREYMDYTEYLRVIGKRASDVSFLKEEGDEEPTDGEKKEVKTAPKRRGRKPSAPKEPVDEMEGLDEEEEALVQDEKISDDDEDSYD
ncbi:DNA-directed RNA polymerase subunit delta [Candidatus Mycoplasma haematolamae str. Purdue]|uniref:RNAP delta factor n=1 Tax=Mycoplasma haematolamae (strain Purdue) TaxID=1212765 RepID=I7CIJ2_MYCHA|nr:DNA-directed RNA polymerase subunit delta [Candidatus Mycoplasma haematolamae]AFO51684.1 DNA-directed RNA polymerase subunit delta [Candidatus Mycoplasma haematolamae str. Purdue]